MLLASSSSAAGVVILMAFGLGFYLALAWLAADASRFEWNHGAWSVFGWVVLCSLFWIVGLPLYVIVRRRRPRRAYSS